MSETSMKIETPRMSAACKEARGIEEGCKLEIELAAYQAAMPEAPKVLDSLEALGAIHATPLVAKADYDALAKRCARLTVERDAAQRVIHAAQEIRIDFASIPLDQQAKWIHLPALRTAIDTAIAAGKEKMG